MDAAHHGGWLGHRSSVLEPRRGSGPAGVDSVGVGQAANIPPGRAQGGVWCGLGGASRGYSSPTRFRGLYGAVEVEGLSGDVQGRVGDRGRGPGAGAVDGAPHKPLF